MKKKIYQEKQRCRNWYLIGLLALLMLGLTLRFVSDQWISPAEDPMPWLTYLVFMSLLALGLGLVLSLRVLVKVTEKSICVKYLPWQRKWRKIKWKDVENFELLHTPESAQWSGWNISFDHEQSYSLCGRTGIHLQTKEGENILIGSRKFDEFRAALSQLFPSLPKE